VRLPYTPENVKLCGFPGKAGDLAKYNIAVKGLLSSA